MEAPAGLAEEEWGVANNYAGCVGRTLRFLSAERRNEGAKMAKKSFPLSKVYGLLEPGPVVLVTTAGKERANIMTQSWHILRTNIAII
jgi:hypothetical protein